MEIGLYSEINSWDEKAGGYQYLDNIYPWLSILLLFLSSTLINKLKQSTLQSSQLHAHSLKDNQEQHRDNKTEYSNNIGEYSDKVDEFSVLLKHSEPNLQCCDEIESEYFVHELDKNLEVPVFSAPAAVPRLRRNLRRFGRRRKLTSFPDRAERSGAREVNGHAGVRVKRGGGRR